MEQTRARRPFIRRRYWSWSWGAAARGGVRLQGSCDKLTGTNLLCSHNIYDVRYSSLTVLADLVEKQAWNPLHSCL